MSKLLIIIALFCFSGSVIAALEPTYAEKVYTQVNHSVLTVLDFNKGDMTKTVAYGSSVAVAPDIVATNCHVALQGELHLVKIDNKMLPSKLIYKNENDDLCLLKISGVALTPVKLRDSTQVNIGEEVFTIATPKGYEKSISRGIISNEIAYKQAKILQTDAAISPGSSGGGLFDREANLIGITFMKDKGEGTEGIGFALPTELIKAVLDQQKH